MVGHLDLEVLEVVVDLSGWAASAGCSVVEACHSLEARQAGPRQAVKAEEEALPAVVAHILFDMNRHSPFPYLLAVLEVEQAHYL